MDNPWVKASEILPDLQIIWNAVFPNIPLTLTAGGCVEYLVRISSQLVFIVAVTNFEMQTQQRLCDWRHKLAAAALASVLKHWKTDEEIVCLHGDVERAEWVKLMVNGYNSKDNDPLLVYGKRENESVGHSYCQRNIDA